MKLAKEEGLTTFLLPCLPRSFTKEAAKQPVWSAALDAGFTTCVGIAVGFYYRQDLRWARRPCSIFCSLLFARNLGSHKGPHAGLGDKVLR